MRLQIRKSALQGFTLLEVMIGITLLVIIVLPLASLYAVSLTTIQQAALYSQALGLARERMEMVQAMDYGSLGWDTESLAPGFEWHNTPGQIAAYFQRDIASTPEIEEFFDPTQAGHAVDYRVPVYRDYYSNFTGQLLDPTFNGLCDDDLNGDGVVDLVDINICNPNGDIWNTVDPRFTFLNGQPNAGDGLYDTVVEGLYTDSYDVLFGIRENEAVAPLQDEILKYDFSRNQNRGGRPPSLPLPISDYQHRNRTFDLFVRMTSIIDPTPRVGNPDDNLTIIDGFYFDDKITNDAWTNAHVAKLIACMRRDLPVWDGVNTLTVGPHRTTANPVIIESQWRENSGFNKNIAPPRQGKKIIVRTFYLSGDGDNSDVDGDGFPDGETLASAKQVVLERMMVDPERHQPGSTLTMGFPGDLTQGMIAPPMKIDRNTYLNIGQVLPDVVDDDFESDFCSEVNDGLPYYTQPYFPNQ